MAHQIFSIEQLEDTLRPGVTHSLDIFEQGGEIVLKVIIAPPSGVHAALCLDGETPYTARIHANLRLSISQLKAIEQAMADARSRIGA